MLIPDQFSRNRSPGKHAQQQLRDLGHAVRNAARDLDRSYPNTSRGNQIIHRYQHQTNKIVQSGRQSRNRSLGGSYYRSSRSSQGPSGFILGLAVLILILMGALNR